MIALSFGGFVLYCVRQNPGTKRTRITKISSRPIIISQMNSIFVGQVKWV